MKLKTIYLVMCIFGIVLPYWQFIPWAAANGLNPGLLFEELFANRISAFFGMDVIVSAIVLIVFMLGERKRLNIKGWWLALIGLLTVGVSLALPLFLYLRERHLEQEPV